MRSAEVRAIGELTGQALAGAGSLVRDLHAAIAERTSPPSALQGRRRA